ncbi:protein EMSY-LIKE 3 [Lathyrus oleraceus]|nr:protein EMSY-LIKE 3-like [Pisum sativum]
MAARVFQLMDQQFPLHSDSKFDENITDSDVLHEIDNFIHRAEMQAYASVLRTFIYKTNDLNQEKQNLIISLLKELKISNDEHKEVLAEIKNDEMIHLVREWKSFDTFSPEKGIKSPFPTDSASQQDQPLSSLSSVESVQDPSVEPAKAAPKDPLIGKKVCTRWSSPNGPFYEADITEYDPAKGTYKVVYGANTPKEFYYWVDLKKILPEHVEWEGADHVPSTVEENEDSDNDNAEEKVKKGVKMSIRCTQTLTRPAVPKSKSKSKSKASKTKESA